MNKKSINKILNCSDWEEIEAFKSFCLPETLEKIRKKIKLSFSLEGCYSKQEEDFIFNDYSEMIEKSFYFYSPKIFQSKTDKNKKILCVSFRKHIYVNIKTNEFIVFILNSNKSSNVSDSLYEAEVLGKLSGAKTREDVSNVLLEMFSDFPSKPQNIEQMEDYGLSFNFKGSNSIKEVLRSAHMLIDIKSHFFKDLFKVRNKKELNSLNFILGNLFSQKKKIVFSKFIDLLGVNVKDFFLKSRTSNLFAVPWLTKGIDIDSDNFEEKVALRKEWFLKLSWFSDVLVQYFLVPWKTDVYYKTTLGGYKEWSSDLLFSKSEEKIINNKIEHSINQFLDAIDSNNKEWVANACSDLITVAAEVLFENDYRKSFYSIEKQNIKNRFVAFLKSKNWNKKILFYIDNKNNKKFVFPHISAILKKYSRSKPINMTILLLSLDETVWSKNTKEFYFLLSKNYFFEDKSFYLPLKVKSIETILKNGDSPSEIFDIAQKFVDFSNVDFINEKINEDFDFFYSNNTVLFRVIEEEIKNRDEWFMVEMKNKKEEMELFFKRLWFVFGDYQTKINKIKEEENRFFNKLEKAWKDFRKSNFIDFIKLKNNPKIINFYGNGKSIVRSANKKISINVNNIFNNSSCVSSCLCDDKNSVCSIRERWFDFLCLNNLATRTISVNSKNKVVSVCYHQLSFLPVPVKDIDYPNKENINVFLKTKNEKVINLIKDKMKNSKSDFLGYDLNYSTLREGIEIPKIRVENKNEDTHFKPEFYNNFYHISEKMENKFIQPFWLLDSFSEVNFDFLTKK